MRSYWSRSQIKTKQKSTSQNWQSPATPQAQNEAPPARRSIFTIGHSTHPIERFIELLTEYRITVVADVRSYPASKRWPQFNQAELQDSLRRVSIEYRWLKHLGGRRHSKRVDSPHTAWEVPAFRSYADYTETADFESGLVELTGLADAAPTAYLCSEGLWWRCHRRIISDYLAVRGWSIEHIMPDGKLKPHVIAPFARVVDGRLIYDVVKEGKSPITGQL
jgi:uncharacterized protein (DUF488 family)